MLHSMKFMLHFRKCYNGQIQCFNDSQENYWLLFCCLLESWYCLPDSCLLHVCNPETTSRVTLASLGTVFQTDSDWTKEISMLMMLFSGFVVLLFSDFVECINNAIN